MIWPRTRAARSTCGPTQDRFIVQFTDVPHFGAPGVTETFEAILHADGSMFFQYAAVGSDAGCTVGIENGPGADGLLIQFNSAASLHAGQAIRIAADPPPSWLTVDTACVHGAARRRRQPGRVHCDATGLALGVYQAFLSLVEQRSRPSRVGGPGHPHGDGHRRPAAANRTCRRS